MSDQNNSEIFFLKNICHNIERLFTPIFAANRNELILNIVDHIPNVHSNSGRYICQALVRLLSTLSNLTQNYTVQLTVVYHHQQVIVSISGDGKNICSRDNLKPFVAIRKIFKTRQIPVSFQFNNENGVLINFELNYHDLKINRNNNVLWGIFPTNKDFENEENKELTQLFHKYLKVLSKEITDLEKLILKKDYNAVEHLLHKMQGFPGGFQMVALYQKIRSIHELVTEKSVDVDNLIADYLCLKSLTDELLETGDLEISSITPKPATTWHDHRPDNADVRILLADDNPMNCEMVSFYLDKLGLLYHVVSNGKEALEHLEKHDYLVLLLDFKMPVLSGPETIKIIRSQKKYDTLKVVGLTTFDASFNKNFYIKLGCNDFLFKPFTEAQLQCLMQKFQLTL